MPRPPVPSAKPTRSARVAIVGRPNVGKSTLLNALIGERIAITSHHPQTTRDSFLGVVHEGGREYVFVDTPGLHRAKTKLGARMNHQVEAALADVDAIIFLTDVPRGPAMRDEDLAIVQGLPTSAPIILVLNKIDKVAAKADLFPLLDAHAKAFEFAAIVPVSALKKDGTAHVLTALRPYLKKGPPLFEDDSISDRPTRFFVAEFVREQVLRKTREEVPHGVAVVVDRFDEDPRVPVIEMSIIVDKPSHKKIVIGHKGSLLKTIGTQARARIERLLGKQVHLKLWVRVVPGWYDNEAKIRELGYGERS